MLIYHLDFSLSSLPISSMNFDKIIKNLVLAKHSRLISITKTNFLIFSEINAFSSENHTKATSLLYGSTMEFCNVKADCVYSKLLVLTG
jgi:hypothetical protein